MPRNPPGGPALLTRMVNSVPLVGPLINTIVKTRKTKNKKSNVRVVVVPAAGKRRKGKGPSRTQLSRQSKSLPDGRITKGPIPVSVNMGATTTRWAFSGRPQALADYDNTKGVKICGSALSPILQKAPAVATGGIVSNFANQLVVGTRFLMTPRSIDARIAIMEQVFSFYAFRKLKITFIPQNSANNSAASNATLFIGIDDNADEGSEATSGVSPQYISELDPSMSLQSVGSQSLFYEHTGTKLWVTDSFNEGDTLEIAQAMIFAITSDTTVYASNPPLYGYFFYEYELDLYRPTAIESSPTIHSPRVRSSDVKDDKHDEKKADTGKLGLSAALDFPKATYASVVQPPSPTKSLLAEELRSLRAQHFPSKVIRSTTVPPSATGL